LTEVFCYSARLSSTSYAIKGYANAFIVVDCAFEGCDLDIWRYTMRHLFEQRSPVEAPINECVERFGRADDAIQFFGTLLRGGDLRLDFGPFTLHPIKMALPVKNPIASPEIVQEQQGGEANASINAQLQGIALSLPLLEDFFVEKI
jgi:hypothetical protein